MESNNYLWVISEYVDRLEWDGVPYESDKGSEEPEEWDSGDEQVVCESDRNIVKRR